MMSCLSRGDDPQKQLSGRRKACECNAYGSLRGVQWRDESDRVGQAYNYIRPWELCLLVVVRDSNLTDILAGNFAADALTVKP